MVSGAMRSWAVRGGGSGTPLFRRICTWTLPKSPIELLWRQVVDVGDFLHFLKELVQEEAQEGRCEGLEGLEGRGGTGGC